MVPGIVEVRLPLRHVVRDSTTIGRLGSGHTHPEDSERTCRSASSPSVTSRRTDDRPDPDRARERIKATVEIAKKAEEVGLDVFATGEHHNPPFVASNPTATLAYIGAKTDDIILSTATTLITTTDPVLIAEDYAKIQHLTDGRRPDDGARQHRPSHTRGSASRHPPGHQPRHRELRVAAPGSGPRTSWTGRQVPHAAPGLTSTPRPLDGVPPFVWHGSIRSPRSPSRRRTTATASSTTTFWPAGHTQQMVDPTAASSTTAIRTRGHRDRRPRRAVLHAPEQPGRGGRVPPVLRQRPGLRARPSLEDFTEATPLTVGSPQQVLERRCRSAATSATTSASCSGRPRRPAAEDRARAVDLARRDPAGDAQGFCRGPA